VHVKAEGYSKPMYFVLTGGERHETVAFPELVRVEKSNDSEGAARIAAGIYGDKATAAKTFANRYGELALLLSFHGVTRSGRDDSTGDCIGSNQQSG